MVKHTQTIQRQVALNYIDLTYLTLLKNQHF